MGTAPSDISVRCALTGTLEVPRLAWLIDRLASLNPDGAIERPEVIKWHAYQIYGHWLHLHVHHRRVETGYIVGKRATRVWPDRGTTKELQRLLQVAKGGSEARWRTAWIGVSGVTRALVMQEMRPPAIVERDGVRHLDATAFFVIDEAGSTSFVVPRLADAAPSVAAALDKVQATPAGERKVRRRDALLDALEGAVRIAFHDITGKRRGSEKLTDAIVERFEPPENLPSKRG